MVLLYVALYYGAIIYNFMYDCTAHWSMLYCFNCALKINRKRQDLFYTYHKAEVISST